MFLGLWRSAKANKENILYTVLTLFLLERVRRGWNRIGARGKADGLTADAVERKQQWFAFRAALLYAVPFVLPVVKYIFRSFHELSQYVDGLAALTGTWAFAVVVVLTEAFLAVVLYNLLGIYVERMNGAIGLFRKIGRSVVDGSKVAVQNSVRAGGRRLHAGALAGLRAGTAVGRGMASGLRSAAAGAFSWFGTPTLRSPSDHP